MHRILKQIKFPFWRLLFYLLAASIALVYLSERVYSGRPYNGFDVGDSLIPAQRIHHGGPPRDGIPAIDKPRFIDVTKAQFLHDQDRILGLDLDGVARAYPIKILNYHEIVNDEINHQPVIITWCPLCGSGMAFSAELDRQKLRFGVSGLLYNSDMLLYDDDSESLWSQLMGQAISGPLKGTRLQMLPLTHTSWIDWRSRYPNSQVLSNKTGFFRDYSRDPYPGYNRSDAIYFPLDQISRRYHPKEQVIGLEIRGQFKAYPFKELAQHKGPVFDVLAGVKFQLIFDPQQRTGHVLLGNGKLFPTVISYWFAWYSFHPETLVFRASQQ